MEQEVEYRNKIKLAKDCLESLLTQNYPAEIYMLKPEECSESMLLEELWYRPTLFCKTDEKHTVDDALPLERISWYPVVPLSPEEIDDSYELVYEGSYSMKPDVCLWEVLYKNGIIKKTAKKYAGMKLYTSPHAVEIIVSNISWSDDSLDKTKKLIEKALSQKPLSNFF